MSDIPVLQATLELECNNVLGEGAVWDSKTQLLHWVDIEKAEIHTLDPETRKYAADSYPETRYLSAIVLRQDKPGFVGTTHDAIAILPAATTPSSAAAPQKPQPRESEQILARPQGRAVPEVRFNDAGCDPRGRLFAGSMGQSGAKGGKLFRYDPDGTVTTILENVGCSNGIGFSPDGKIMYYIDSSIDQIDRFDYDVSTGTPSNRRAFVTTPPAIPGVTPPKNPGLYDGLCMDGLGNLWVARWRDSRVVGLRPDGSIICFIRVEGCKSPTIPIFGGKNLETMYIASASANLAGEGEIQADFPHSGDLFSVDFSKGSQVRKLLPEGWKGAERHRFGA